MQWENSKESKKFEKKPRAPYDFIEVERTESAIWTTKSKKTTEILIKIDIMPYKLNLRDRGSEQKHQYADGSPPVII